MSSHPNPGHDPKAATVPIRMDPIIDDHISEDDIEPAEESGKDRLFGYLKWMVFLSGAAAVLYFGGSVVKGYLVSDLEQKIKTKEQEIELLKQSSPEESSSLVFEVVVKQVTSSPRGKAYLVTDAMGQPWFVISGLEFKVSDKVLLELKLDPKEKSAQVAFKKINKEESTSAHSVNQEPVHEHQGESHEAPKPAHH